MARGFAFPTGRDIAARALKTLDARGKPCPVPILELAKAVIGLPPDALIALEATDPAVESDVTAWCQMTGNDLESLTLENDIWRAVIRKRR